jgi:N-acetylglucosamine-6-phosphate deacetylase
MILKNARFVFADGIRDRLEIVVEDGRIAAIREGSGTSSGSDIDLEGNYLAPGFIDLHVHGAMGRDTMEGSSDAFRAICDYHATGGTTSLLLTTATSPVPEILEVLRAIKTNRPTLPQIAGAHVEGPFLSKEKPGAQQAEFIRDPDMETVGRFLQHADVVRRITIAPELPGALEAIRSFHAAGINVSGGHSNAWDEEARAAFECGMRTVTHTFNCMSSARRRGVERVAGLLEFALSEPEITCELIADGHHVSPTLMKMLLRAKGGAGVCLITDATAGAGLPDGTAFSLAGKPCVVRGGVCLLADGSALAGSASRMIDLIRVMVRQVSLPVYEAVRMATDIPARVIGSNRKGRLEIGADADFVVISDDLTVVRTFVSGREVFRL